MKKSTFATAILLAASTVLSFTTLFCCFQEGLQLIFKEAVYAIFTGCIFAIPSALLMLILDRAKNMNAEYNTVYKLDEAFQQLGGKLDSSGITLEVMEEYGNRISAYDAKLNQIAIDYCFFSKWHRDCLDAVQSATFDIILTIHTIKESLQEEMAGTVPRNEATEKTADLKCILMRCSGCTKKLLGLLH